MLTRMERLQKRLSTCQYAENFGDSICGEMAVEIVNGHVGRCALHTLAQMALKRRAEKEAMNLYKALDNLVSARTPMDIDEAFIQAHAVLERCREAQGDAADR